MFCPQCKTEYLPGFTQCADCNVALVAELSRDPEDSERDHNVEFVEIFRTQIRNRLSLVLPQLKAEGIDFQLLGQVRNMYGRGFQPHILMVALPDVDRAREILNDFLQPE
jgi:hypothetical protein